MLVISSIKKILSVPKLNLVGEALYSKITCI